MAEQLGTAELLLVINDKAFKKGVDDAKRYVQSQLGGAADVGAPRRAAAPRPTAAQLTQPARNPITGLTTAYETLERVSGDVLENDLRRLQVIRQITERLQEQADLAAKPGFGEASRATFGTQDPVEKSIRRNREKQAKDAARVARQEEQAAAQRANLEEDLAQTTARRVGQQERAAGIAKAFLGDQQQQIKAERQLANETNKRRQATVRLGKDIAANALIGGGFPLLFGQGFGAAAGGALGGGLGAVGGGTFGFAGSIVGTALGAAFDTALQKAQQLAQGLDDPIKNFDALRQAALLSSKAVERNAESLIAAGREEEAAALIRADLNRTFGSPEAAAEFTAATDELNRAWSQATASLTAFVAGPLAKFLRGVSIFLGGGPAATAAADVARARQIAASSPEKQAQLERLVRQRGGRLNAEGNIAGAPSVPIFREYLKLNGELTAEQKNQKALTDAMSEGAARTAQANRLNLAIIEESARGNKEAAAQKELELLAIEKTRRLNALPQTATDVDRQRIDQEFAEKRASAEEKLTAARQERARATFEEFQKQQQIERSIANTLQLLGAQRGEYRDTLRTIQQISTTINEARQREAEIGFQIDQARQGGREEDAARLVEQQRTAATETRARLVEGALALTEAGEKLRDNLRSSVLELAKLQGGEGGLNRFLSQGLQQQRAEQTNAALQPFLREALGRFRQLIPNADLSNINQVLGGRTTAEVNANIIDFIESVNREFQATQNVQGAQAALQEVNKALVDVNSQLLGATQALAQKDWVVNIEVVNQAGGASTVNTVNSLAS